MDTEEILSKFPADTGVELIAAERKRQIEVEGWTTEHDAGMHQYGDLAMAAATYALKETFDIVPFEIQNKTGIHMTIERKAFWPWAKQWWKPALTNKPKDRIRELVKAGALIAAEIDRLQKEPVQ